MSKRMEKPIRNNPGLCKEFKFDGGSGTWKETGKIRAIRRVIENGQSKKQQGVFDNIEDAKAFRLGTLDKTSSGESVHKKSVEDRDQRFTFSALVNDWKALHFLQVEFTTKQHYENRLPHLGFLNALNVEEIGIDAITKLINHWVSAEYPKPKDRMNFEKELEVLKVILNYYRRYKNQRYFIPILPEHYRAADFSKKPSKPPKALKEEHVGPFLNLLKERYPQYYPLALIQLGLGLRVSEACGLHWSDFDLETGESNVSRSIAWNSETRQLVSKSRKNAQTLESVVPEFVAVVLKELKEKRDPKVKYIFHQNGIPMRRQYIGRAYNSVLRELGIEYVNGTHMLRKTSGTLARKITQDVYAASKMLGHSSVTVTEKYYQEHLDEDKQKVAKALNSVLVKAAGGDPNNSEGKTMQIEPPVPQYPTKSARPMLTLIKTVG